MNPFQLTGGSFLLFYFLLALVINLMLRWVYRVRESTDVSGVPPMSDPYLIANLRGGTDEALRIATIALIDRGLLQATGESLRTSNKEAVDFAKRPIEKAILQRYLSGGEAEDILYDRSARATGEAYLKVLKAGGLVADADVRRQRAIPFVAALGVLVAVAVIKIGIALSQGRHNIGFLIVLAIIACIAAGFAYFRHRTAKGDAMMADLRELFARLEARAGTLAAGGQTNEAALLAAVFGLSALSVSTFPFVKTLYPKKSSGDGGGGGDGGSSCGSGGCGGGCGGGGCGG